MKKSIIIATAAATVAMAGTAMAATTSTDLSVSANVLSVCTASTNTNIDFGNLNPLTDGATTKASDKTSAGQITVKCTAGTSYNLSAPTTPQMTLTTGGSSYNIKYSPIIPSGQLSGSVAGTSHTIDATVAKADYSTAPAGAYTGTLTVTVTY